MPPRLTSQRWLWLGGLAGLFAIAFVVYWPYLDDFLALDDYIWLHSATNANFGDFLRGAFSFPTGSATDVPTPFWRPAIDLYFYGGWRVFSDDATPYHVINVLIHGGVAALTAVLVWQLCGSRLAGLAAGLLFVVLPTYDYAVTWISSVTELLGAFFYLLTLVLYAAYLQRAEAHRALYAGALAALFLALLSKESAVTLPAALVGLVIVLRPPRDGAELRARAIELAPFAALVLAYFILQYTQEYASASSDGGYRFGPRVFDHLWDFLGWLVLPLPNSFASWVEPLRPALAWAFLASGAAAIALRNRAVSFAFLWTIVALVPYGFFRGGIEYRYTYLACVPFVVFLALGGHALAARLATVAGPRLVLAGAAALVLALAVFLGTQVRGHQETIADQAMLYGDLYHQAPELCGDLPPEAHIFILYSPIYDLYGASLPMVLNLRYDDVTVGRGSLPPLAAFIEHKCVIEYDTTLGKYVRVD